MKTFNPSQILFIATTFFLLTVSLKAQDSPQDFLAAHNQARATVGVAPLIWDETVAAFARNYANQRLGDCALQHSTNRPYGENIARSTGNLSGVEAVKLWVDEKMDYDYSSNTCASDKVCGHYTQVVWRNSLRLGCAKVRCNSQTFITCNYDPPGNFIGQRPF